MVYKIVGNFTDDNLEKILNRVKTRFQFIYVADSLYVALKNIELDEGHEVYLRNTFKPSREFLVTPINEKNIMKLEENIMTWCRDNLLRLDAQRYERDNQEKLQRMWKQLDMIEEELEQKMVEQLNQQNEGTNGVESAVDCKETKRKED